MTVQDAEVIPLDQDPDVQRRRWLILGVMCLSLVMVVMAVSGLNTALPSIATDLDAGSTELQWIVDAYALVFAGLLLSAGALGDRFGRKGALQLGLVVFAGAALVCAVADDSGQLITGRAVMGVGAALAMPATLSIITNVFPREERGRAIAIWAGFAGAGGAIGPIVSGGLLEGFWWGSVFLVNIPIIAVILLLISMVAPKSRDEAAGALDPVGSLLSLVGLAALLFGIIEGPERGWTDSLVLAAFAVAALVLVAFVRWEQRSSHPMLPMSFFANRSFSAASVAITLAFFAMFGLFFLLSQFLQLVRSYSALGAGVATLPLAFMLILVSPRSAGFAERFGARQVMVTGFAFLTAGFLVLSTMGVDTSYLLLAGGLVLLGIGMGVAVAPATGALMSSVPLGKAGVGSAVNDTTRELGGALGIAVLGSVVASAYRGAISTAGLPADAAEAAKDSVGAALGIADQIGGERGAALALDASSAFADGFSTGMLAAAAAAVAAVGLLVTLRFMPTRAAVAPALEPAVAGAGPPGGQ